MRRLFHGTLLLLGCSGSTDTGNTTTDTSADTHGATATGDTPAFIGLSFLLESADGYAPLADVDVRLSFSEDSEGILGFGLSPGCNGMSGEFTIDEEDRMVVSVLGMTEMACDTALMAQDDWFLNFVQDSPFLSYEAPRLTLTGSEATLVFSDTEVATPDRELTGVLWTIDSYIDGEMAMAYNLASPPTLSFDEDGKLSFSDSCNLGMADYSASADTLILSNFSTSYLECEDEMVIEASNHFHSVMTTGETTFEIDANRITLMRDSLGLSGTGD